MRCPSEWFYTSTAVRFLSRSHEKEIRASKEASRKRGYSGYEGVFHCLSITK